MRVFRMWPSKIKIGLILSLLLIFVAVFYRTSSHSDASYAEYTVKRGDITDTVTISGNANELGNASIYSPSTGIVSAVFVTNGQSVTKNAELATVASTATEIDRSNAYAAYLEAVAAENLASQAKITNQSLLESSRKSVIDASIARQQMIDRRNIGAVNPSSNKSYTQDEIDSIESAYTSASKTFSSVEKKFLDTDQNIAAAKSAVTAAWLSYQATQNGIIRSPIDGVVTNLSVATGDAVLAKTPTNQPLPLLRISTSNETTIVVKLNEIDISKIREGQRARVRFDAIPDKTFQAIVSRVNTVGENINAVVTYTAYLNLSEQDERIRPTMTVTVIIETDKKTGVLTVPNVAFIQQDGTPHVRNVSGNLIPVQVGLKSSETSEILEGVKEGDVLLIPRIKK